MEPRFYCVCRNHDLTTRVVMNVSAANAIEAIRVAAMRHGGGQWTAYREVTRKHVEVERVETKRVVFSDAKAVA